MSGSCARFHNSLLQKEKNQGVDALKGVAATTKMSGEQFRYWIPGGVGDKHKLPQGAKKVSCATSLRSLHIFTNNAADAHCLLVESNTISPTQLVC